LFKVAYFGVTYSGLLQCIVFFSSVTINFFIMVLLLLTHAGHNVVF
jgi:hypothetical protein